MPFLESSTTDSMGEGSSTLHCFRNARLQVLRDNGWPEGNHTDTIFGAAGFTALATVDVYHAVPPTCIRRWSAHFAEMIVKAHLYEIITTKGLYYTPNLPRLESIS
jgi:hypothetical protein